MTKNKDGREKAPSVRLTNEMRWAVLKALLAKAFDEEYRVYNQACEALGDLVYDDVYDRPARRMMARLPDGFLPEASQMKVSFGGEVDLVHFSKPRRIANKHDGYEWNKASVYGCDHAFSVEHGRLVRLKRDLEERYAKAKKDAMAVLESCRTTGQLVEVWPEVAPFVEPLVDSPEKRVTSLTVPIAVVNDELGLGGVPRSKSGPKSRLAKYRLNSLYGKCSVPTHEAV